MEARRAALLGLALAAVEGAGLLLLIPLLSSVGLAVDQGLTSGLSRRITAAFAFAGLRPTLLTVLGIFLATSTVQALLYRTYLLLNPALEQQFVQALRNRLYAAVVKVDWSFFITQRTNDLVYGVTAEVDRAGTAVFQLLNLFAGLAVSAVYIAIAFRLSPGLTLLVGAVGLVLLWLLRGRTRRSSELGEQYSAVNRRQFNMISESIASLKTAKSFGAERRDIVIFAEHARQRTAAYLDLLRSYARSKMSVDLSTAVVIAALLYVAVEWLGLRGAGLLMLIYVFGRVMPRVMSLQESAQIIFAGLPSFATVTRLIDECEAHAERVAQSSPEGLGDETVVAALPFHRELRLENVSYAYKDGSAKAVSEISLSIPRWTDDGARRCIGRRQVHARGPADRAPAPAERTRIGRRTAAAGR